jgi:hypothetical protein
MGLILLFGAFKLQEYDQNSPPLLVRRFIGLGIGGMLMNAWFAYSAFRPRTAYSTNLTAVIVFSIGCYSFCLNAYGYIMGHLVQTIFQVRLLAF